MAGPQQAQGLVFVTEIVTGTGAAPGLVTLIEVKAVPASPAGHSIAAGQDTLTFTGGPVQMVQCLNAHDPGAPVLMHLEQAPYVSVQSESAVQGPRE